MKVLVIPEDPHLDQHILKPVIERVFEDLSKKARIEVLQNPRIRGVEHALDRETIDAIVTKNRMVDVFLLVVDRDCAKDRRARLDALEQRHPGKLLATMGVEELESWLLALHRRDVEERHKVNWTGVRSECHPKETFAEPLLERLGDGGPGNGRKSAMGAIAKQWKSLCELCPEIPELRERIRARLETAS